MPLLSIHFLRDPVKYYFSIVIVFLCLLGGCSEHFPNQPISNQPPDTYLTLMPDSTLRSTTSQQHVHWWGVDPDGFVKGYFISLDSLSWTFTTSNDSILGLKISTTDTTYKFFVAAVDNQGLKDPKPASLQYPIHNSPPVLSFIAQSDVPDTTFTVAAFQWNSFDLDGNESIVAYYYALDDTTNPSHWKSLTGHYSRVMLRKSDGLTEGRHVFYLKARDVAGAYSQTIRMPIDTTKTWYVKDPEGKSDFLIIRDWIWDDGAASYYGRTIDSVMGGRLSTAYIWDIKAGWSNTTRGKYVPALINPTFTESIKLFKYILWYADNDPQLDIAQASLPAFEATGGKILFTTGFSENPVFDPRGFGDFAPIDSIENYCFSRNLIRNFNAIGDSIVVVDTTYPRLYRDYGTSANGVSYLRGILPKANAHIIYQMGQSRLTPQQGGWSDRNTRPIIMGVQNADQPSIVFLAFSLNRFSGHESGGKPFIPNNASAFLRKVFYDEFGVR
jgi:hypothetical protein